jgi:hypothetical protein
MHLSDETIETLRGIMQSWVAATGEPFTEISSPEVRKAWKELMSKDGEARAWVLRNCRLARRAE